MLFCIMLEVGYLSRVIFSVECETFRGGLAICIQIARIKQIIGSPRAPGKQHALK